MIGNTSIVPKPYGPVINGQCAFEKAFIDAAIKIEEDADLRNRLATNGLKYAIATFDIEKIADEFEAIILSV